MLLGKGDGTFYPAVAYGAYDGGLAVAIADLNRDGWPDLVTTHGGGAVSVQRNAGDGTFAPPSLSSDVCAVGAYPTSVAIADLDCDGRLDLAVGNADPTVSVLLGNGDGSFALATSYAVPGSTQSIAIGDLTAADQPDGRSGRYGGLSSRADG